MPNPVVAIGAGSVIQGVASNSAASKQANAAAQAGRLTMDQYQQTRQDLKPWRNAGASANQLLMEYLGLATPASRIGPAPTREQFTTTTPGALVRRDQGPAGATYSQGPGTSVFDQAGYDRAMAEYNARLREAGMNPEYYGSLLDRFTGEDLYNEPGYQFGLSEGEKAIMRAASATGGRNSGATLKALARFTQDYAGTKYNEAFNRDAASKGQIYSMLSGVSGTGVNAAGQTAGLGAAAAANAGNALMGGANASAAGMVGMGNAITGGIGTALNYQQSQNMLNTLRQNNTGAGQQFYTMGQGSDWAREIGL